MRKTEYLTLFLIAIPFFYCLAEEYPPYLFLSDSQDIQTSMSSITIESGYIVELSDLTLKTGLDGPGSDDPQEHSHVSIDTDGPYEVDAIISSKITPPLKLYLVSPLTISVVSRGGDEELAFVNLKITKIEETESIPTNTVVVPSDATGPVSIILEQSEDLVNWTAANPGSYGTSTTKRFFRVRAEQQ